MIAEKIQEIKLQEKVCPDCGGELDADGNCPICNPGTEEDSDNSNEDLEEGDLDEEGELN
jgi:tRNA(Ile2) C34 agmatinyltransferase TiaS